MKLLVFAGAGASVSLGYPTTKQFNDELPEDIKKNSIYSTLLSSSLMLPEDTPEDRRFLKEVGIQPIDIERILWRLKEISNPLILAQNDSIFWEKHAEVRDPMFNFLKQIQDLQSEIEKQIYNAYSSTKLKDKRMSHMDYWLTPSLLKHISNIYDIEIFTTNYDRAIEKVIEDNGLDYTNPFNNRPFSDGLKIDEWSHGKAFTRSVWLTKLHGSINWRYGNDEQQIIQADESHSEKNSILYPGFKGKPEKTPFKEFHQYFAGCLEKCDTFLILGFSFRDEHINDLTKDNLKRGSRVVIVDKYPEELCNKKEIWDEGGFSPSPMKKAIGKDTFGSPAINRMTF